MISDSDKLGVDSLVCIGKLACLWTESYSLKEICVWQIISGQRFEAEEQTNQLSRDRLLTKHDQWRRLEEIAEKLGLRGGIHGFISSIKISMCNLLPLIVFFLGTWWCQLLPTGLKLLLLENMEERFVFISANCAIIFLS